MNGILEEVVIILFLILLNGFFAGSEAAFLAVRPSRIKELLKRGGSAARIVERFKKHPENFLSTVQVGVTLVATLASVVSGARVVDFLVPYLRDVPVTAVQAAAEPIAIGLVVIAVSFLSLVIGELVPKYYALARPGLTATRAAHPVLFFSWLTYPVVKILSGTSSAIAGLLGVRRGQATTVTDEELKLLALEGTRHGNIDHTERRLVHAALSFTHIVGRNVMTPRTEISGIDIQWKKNRILHVMVEERYSRYPVFRGDLDQVIGILYTKDVLRRLAVGKEIEFEKLLREPYFVPDSMPIGELLAKFQAKRTHIAVVLDEFGGTAGLITLEDILEELVGEIRDEHDRDEVRDFVRRNDHHAIVAGHVTVEDFNDYFAAELPTDGPGTIGGLLSDELDRIPQEGDVVTFGPITLRVLRADARRVLSVDATRETVSERG